MPQIVNSLRATKNLVPVSQNIREITKKIVNTLLTMFHNTLFPMHNTDVQWISTPIQNNNYRIIVTHCNYTFLRGYSQ